MPLDFEKLKQGMFNRQANQGAAQSQPQVASAKKSAVSNAKVSAFKKGLLDVKTVIEEGNYKLFLKQLIFLLIVFICATFLMGKMAAQKAIIVDKVAALAIQKENQGDYLANKERLLRLEPLFPDLSQKGDWLLQTLMKEFDSHKIQANIDGNVIENADDTRVVISQDVSFQQGFSDLGNFLADVENGDDFVRITELSITKLLDPAVLGENSVKVRFNTVFPKEKYAKKLFKDYDKQMAQIQGEKTPATEPAVSQGKGGTAK